MYCHFASQRLPYTSLSQLEYMEDLTADVAWETLFGINSSLFFLGDGLPHSQALAADIFLSHRLWLGMDSANPVSLIRKECS